MIEQNSSSQPVDSHVHSADFLSIHKAISAPAQMVIDDDQPS
jgi:hypothetical protein